MEKAALPLPHRPSAFWLEPENSLPAMPHWVDTWPPTACTISMPSPTDRMEPRGFTKVPKRSVIISTLPRKPPVATMTALALTSSTPSPSHWMPTQVPSSMMRRLPAVLNTNSPPLASMNCWSGPMRSTPLAWVLESFGSDWKLQRTESWPAP